MAITTALVTPGATVVALVLLVMLPADEQVMIVQVSPTQTIAELEAFIVDEYANVFPSKAPLSRNVRVQKCVPITLVANRRKRSHDQANGKAKDQLPKPQHSFVELSKTVQVGNVFTHMEQIYVVHNHGNQSKPTQSVAPVAVAQPLALPPAQPEGKKKKKQQAKQALAEANGAKETAQPAKEKEAKSVPATKPTAATIEKKEKQQEMTSLAAEPKQTASEPKPVRKSRKASADADSAIEPVKEAAAEPPAKKAKVTATKVNGTETTEKAKTKAATKKVAAVAAKTKADAKADTKAEPAIMEPATKGRKKKQPEAEHTAPPAKRAKKSDAEKTTDTKAAEKTEAVAEAPQSKNPPRRSFQDTLAAARERVETEKRAKETGKTSKPAADAKASTTDAKAVKSPELTTKASATTPPVVAKSPETQSEKPAKRSFHEILAATRARIESEKKGLSESDSESSNSESTISHAVPVKAKPAAVVTKAVAEEDNNSTSSDSDFEDAKAKVNKPKPAALKAEPKTVTKVKRADSSEDSTDDESLDYSQSLLADLTKDDKSVAKKSASHFLPSPTPASTASPAQPEKKRRGRPPKTKVVLPSEDTDIAPESSQETVLDSQPTAEANSVMASSLSKNRFSLDNIPVAKLKKSAKNPFKAAEAAAATTTTGDAAEPPKKRGPGRPRKVKQ